MNYHVGVSSLPDVGFFDTFLTCSARTISEPSARLRVPIIGSAKKILKMPGFTTIAAYYRQHSSA
jgi:hypothetical protein